MNDSQPFVFVVHMNCRVIIHVIIVADMSEMAESADIFLLAFSAISAFSAGFIHHSTIF
jgi:hypothetical protein